MSCFSHAKRARRYLFFISTIIFVTLFYSCSSYDYPKDYGFIERVSLPGHSDQVIDIDISYDGKYLASGSFDDTARVWDTELFTELGESEVHPDDIYSVSLSDDMQYLATGCRDGAIRVYSLPDGELVHLMRGHAEEVYSIDFSPDGKQLLSGGKDTTVRVWDVQTGDLLKVLRGHGDAVNSVVVSINSEIGYSASNDGTVRAWYLQEDLAPGFIDKITRFALTSIALSPDGKKIALTGMDKVLDKASNQWNKEFPLYIADIGRNGIENIEMRLGHTKAVWGLAWAPDGKTIVTGGTDNRLFFHDVANSDNRQKVLPKVGSIWDLEFSPDGSKLFVASSSPDILVYMK